MNAADTILSFAARGIELRLEADELRARVPRGVLSDDDRAIVARLRPEIIAVLGIVHDTAINVSREPAAVVEAWRREIVDGLRWAKLGNGTDPNLSIDVLALRRLVPFGRCLACDGASSHPHAHWCSWCEETERLRVGA